MILKFEVPIFATVCDRVYPNHFPQRFETMTLNIFCKELLALRFAYIYLSYAKVCQNKKSLLYCFLVKYEANM